MVTAKLYTLCAHIMECARSTTVSELDLVSAFIELSLREETDVNQVVTQVKGNILIGSVQQRGGT